MGADAKTFAITLREGHGPQDVVCIEIAESRRAIVDLGDLAPGTYTISDTTGERHRSPHRRLTAALRRLCPPADGAANRRRRLRAACATIGR